MKIGRLMIWIAAIGLFCAMLGSMSKLFVLILFVACLGLGLLGWKLARRFPMPTLRAFVAWAAAFGSTILLQQSRLFDADEGFQVLFLLIAGGLVPGLGAGLRLVSSFAANPPRRRAPIAWLLVAIGFPLAAWFAGDWPLRLAFRASRPALERLAGRVEREGEISVPERAGMYRIVASRRDPRNGETFLLINDQYMSQSGFARNPKPIQPGDDNLDGSALIWLRLGLDPPWSYKYEDTFLGD